MRMVDVGAMTGSNNALVNVADWYDDDRGVLYSIFRVAEDAWRIRRLQALANLDGKFNAVNVGYK